MSGANETAAGRSPPHGPRATVEARKLSAAAPGREANAEFSYVVLSGPGRAAAGERRRFTRLRTKLRSGKIVDSGGRFITECLIHNRSASGCRLRLPASVALPPSILFFEDQSERLLQAVVMWQRDRDVGIRLLPQAMGGLNRAIAERMRRRFYVLPR